MCRLELASGIGEACTRWRKRTFAKRFEFLVIFPPMVADRAGAYGHLQLNIAAFHARAQHLAQPSNVLGDQTAGAIPFCRHKTCIDALGGQQGIGSGALTASKFLADRAIGFARLAHFQRTSEIVAIDRSSKSGSNIVVHPQLDGPLANGIERAAFQLFSTKAAAGSLKMVDQDLIFPPGPKPVISFAAGLHSSKSLGSGQFQKPCFPDIGIGSSQTSISVRGQPQLA